MWVGYLLWFSLGIMAYVNFKQGIGAASQSWWGALCEQRRQVGKDAHTPLACKGARLSCWQSAKAQNPPQWHSKEYQKLSAVFIYLWCNRYRYSKVKQSVWLNTLKAASLYSVYSGFLRESKELPEKGLTALGVTVI